MKKIIILILIFAFFSCDKDEPDTLNAKYSKEEILSVITGTWKFNRLAYDPEFKNIKEVTFPNCHVDAYTIFTKQETFTSYMRYCDSITTTEEGKLAIVIEDSEIHILPLSVGIALTPTVRYHGPIPLYSFTDSTLVFSEAVYYSKDETECDEYHLYSELNRVK